MENSKIIDEKLLSEIQRYYDEGNSIAEVARKFNSTYSILRGLKQRGLLKFRENNHCNQYSVKVPDEETLKLMQSYYNDLHSLYDLEEKFNISYSRLVTLGKNGFLKFDCSEKRRHELSSKKSKGRKHSEKTKKLLSEKRKKWILENPDKSPYILSHKSRGETYSEKYFREWLEKEQIPFQQEYKFKLYSFDFLVNERVDLEIDGGQHKNDKRIIEHDIKRDTESKKAGFNVYRIVWSDYQRLNQKEKEKFLVELKEFLSNTNNPIPQFVIKKRTRNYNVREKKNCSFKTKNTKVSFEQKQHAISLLKQGMSYVQVGKKFKVSDNAIRKWVKSLGLDPKHFGRDGKKK